MNNTFEFIEDYEEIDSSIGEIIYDETFTVFLCDMDCYDKYLRAIISQSRGFHYLSSSWVIELHGETLDDVNDFLTEIKRANIGIITERFIEDSRYGWLINDVFQWARTIEGVDYWTEIYNKSKELR